MVRQLIGATRGWRYPSWLSMWWWAAVRNPANYYSRVTTAIDITGATLRMLAGTRPRRPKMSSAGTSLRPSATARCSAVCSKRQSCIHVLQPVRHLPPLRLQARTRRAADSGERPLRPAPVIGLEVLTLEGFVVEEDGATVRGAGTPWAATSRRSRLRSAKAPCQVHSGPKAITGQQAWKSSVAVTATRNWRKRTTSACRSMPPLWGHQPMKAASREQERPGASVRKGTLHGKQASAASDL